MRRNLQSGDVSHPDYRTCNVIGVKNIPAERIAEALKPYRDYPEVGREIDMLYRERVR